MEFFSWRGFHDQREVGALAGLTPTPYQSGESAQEQGISKAGNRYIRAMAIELAWDWLLTSLTASSVVGTRNALHKATAGYAASGLSLWLAGC